MRATKVLTVVAIVLGVVVVTVLAACQKRELVDDPDDACTLESSWFIEQSDEQTDINFDFDNVPNTTNSSWQFR